MSLVDQLNSLVPKFVKEQIIEEYQTPDRQKANENTTLGIAIAQYCDWNPDRILAVFMEACEDANMHTEARELTRWSALLDNDKAFDEYWDYMRSTKFGGIEHG